MGLPSTAMRCVLNIINVGMAIFGLLLIALATLALRTAPPVYIYYLYIVGGVSFLAALLGCCGICKEDVCLTSTYAVIILGSLVAQVIGKIYATDSETIKNFASEDVEKTWLEEIQHPGAMNKTQQTYYCCGRTGPNDYLLLNRQGYPPSCYPKQIVNATALFSTGCIQAAQANFVDVFNYSSTGEWGHLILTILAFVFAVYLIIRFRSKQRRYNY